ncbi:MULTISPECIES: RAMP superfamily CRISPR-associated protein [unclassified Coleofasciculus]|uniref:RAMP superfamily CRISPR-associated protein n=1 Tax=unclassified Coleofasciculus TaxID=2692782 RepID=UPI00187F6FB2|nr:MULTISPECIES: RAMP superfamily CRISPR-associated protein [unclassified Coleofasciculus]MBE9129429.1 RAMP superfamily protein [Coleofasciculus sp. LEGE 07081]MBE9152161.1 RAMP superfamily protein [Coleofasciculus sp. LEGE 07092]
MQENGYPYSGIQLINLLEKQHQARSQSDLFKKGTFTLTWRAKVGSFPHPDIETIVSAGEPCGAWKPTSGRPEAKRNVGANLEQMPVLPLNGYIPGSAIRGLVRAWAKKRPDILPRMQELLGYQENDNTIRAGKIEFLDAWSEQPTQLTLDIVNPQQPFQVYHEGQSTPLSFYTLGNGKDSVSVTVAIRGIPHRATPGEVEEVWEWVQQALSLYGVGSRTASGYGSINVDSISKPTLDPGWARKTFEFTLYSQGCAGADMRTPELRPTHWRGWLRSWILRFLLGVMSQDDAQATVGELLGVLEPESRLGCVRLQMVDGKPWGKRSEDYPNFYTWKGQLQLSAPKTILSQIILPIVQFAVMVGGVGRGWRRPLHIFQMNNGQDAARGSYLTLKQSVKKPGAKKSELKLYGLPIKSESWDSMYQGWLEAVRQHWSNRVISSHPNPVAEVFSPATCAVYAVPGPVEEPISREYFTWEFTNPQDTRGDGINLIYQPVYKRKPDVGGLAASGGNSHCSWVSIRRVNIPHKEEDTNCQEIVCLFMGGKTPQSQHLRSQFLQDLAKIPGAVHLLGVQPANSN